MPSKRMVLPQNKVTQVENIEKEAEELQKKYRQLCRCLCNICPNVWSVYKISKMAANKLAETRSLQQSEPTPDRITSVQRPLHHVMPTPSSKSSYLESALRYVKGAEHNIIGILGMGGVGKTHLMMQIHEQLKPPEFDAEVIYIPCPMQCSDEEIQNKIIENRGISKKGSMEQNKSTICKFLSETSFVLILDNLWSCVNLHNIGIPNPENTLGIHKQKVVLTTQSKGVCGEMSVEKIIQVNPLKSDDAWPLFEKMATKETINSHPLIKKYAVDIVEKLGGLPLVIIAVGKSMYSKRDPSEWEHTLERLEKAGLNDVESQCKDEFVFHRLKISYDNLRNETLKNCFLHCSLWPHGFEIPKDELVELWMGLGLIDEPDLQTAYNVGFSYIGELKRVFLLQGDDDEKFITMHDVIRDMALWIKKDKWIVQVGTNTGSVNIGISNCTEVLSAMKTGATDFSFSSQDSSTKTINTLLLNRNYQNTSITLPLQLFSLLTVLDLSHNKLHAFPVAICTLVHLQFLNLSHNLSCGLLPTELGDLTELKYLLLRGLDCVFPEGVLLKLKALRVLDCSHSFFIYGNQSNEKLFSTLGEVQRLPYFQALGISVWEMHDDDISNFCNNVSVPVRWLDVCGHEGSCLSFSSSFLGKSQFSNFLYCIDIKETNVENVEFKFDQSTGQNQSSCRLHRLEYLHFRKMWDLKNVIWNNLNPKDVFPRLQVLEFENCPMLSSISWVINLPCIQELRVIQCHNLEQLICIDEQKTDGINVSRYDVPLKKMHLGFNGKLRSISDPKEITFEALEILEVYECGALKKLPFKTGDLPKNLKKIRGPEKWWNEVEIEDGSPRSSLRPFFEKLW